MRGLDRSADAIGAQRIERLEGQLLEFDANGVHAESVRDRGVELEGLARRPFALVQGHDADGAHVVQAVGEFHQDDAQVARRGHGHLLEILRLGLGPGIEDGRQFGDAVDDFRHLGTERCGKRRLGYAGVLEHVVHDRRHDRLVIHAHPGEDGGDGEGMGDVLVAGAPKLTGVGAFGESIRSPYRFDFLLRQVFEQRLQQLLDVDGDGDFGCCCLGAELVLKVRTDLAFGTSLAFADLCVGSDGVGYRRGRDTGKGRVVISESLTKLKNRLLGHLLGRRRGAEVPLRPRLGSRRRPTPRR